MADDEKIVSLILFALVLGFGAWLAIWPDAYASYLMRMQERARVPAPKKSQQSFWYHTYPEARRITRWLGIAFLVGFGYALVRFLFF